MPGQQQTAEKPQRKRKPRPVLAAGRASTSPRTPLARRDYDAFLVGCLVRGMSVKAAAAACDISVRTVHRRMNEPAFRDELEAAKSNVVSIVAEDVMKGAVEAVLVLRTIMKDETQPAAARVTAATRLTELALSPRYEIETTTTTITVTPEAAVDRMNALPDRVRRNMATVHNLIDATAADTTGGPDGDSPEAPVDEATPAPPGDPGPTVVPAT